MSQTSFVESPILHTATGKAKLHVISSDGPTTLGLAESLGLLDEEFGFETDLDFHIERAGFGNHDGPSREGFWIREIDHATALWERSRGLDSHLVGLSWLEGSFPVVTLTGSGIRSATELKGKRLGIIKSTDSPFDVGYAQQLKIYATVLSTARLTLADVELVPIEYPRVASSLSRGSGAKLATIELHTDLAARLRRGEIDAITVALASDIAHHISVRILSDTQDHYDYIARVHPGVLRGVVVGGSLLRERRDLVVRILVRLQEAADWAKTQKAAEIALKLADSGELDPEALVSKYEGLAKGFQIDFSTEKILGLRAQTNFLLRHRLIQKNVDLYEWIEHGVLAEAQARYAESSHQSVTVA